MGNLSCCGDHSRGADELVLQQSEQEEKIKQYQAEIVKTCTEIATLEATLSTCDDDEKKAEI